MILETGGGQVGVMVDAVEEVLTVESGQLEPVPTANTDTIAAIAKIDGHDPGSDELAAAAA